MQLMLGTKEYIDDIQRFHDRNKVTEKKLVFDFEPASGYYKGRIEIRYYTGYDFYVSNLSVKFTLVPKAGETPISRRMTVSRSELKSHIETYTGKTLSF